MTRILEVRPFPIRDHSWAYLPQAVLWSRCLALVASVATSRKSMSDVASMSMRGAVLMVGYAYTKFYSSVTMYRYRYRTVSNEKQGVPYRNEASVLVLYR